MTQLAISQPKLNSGLSLEPPCEDISAHVVDVFNYNHGIHRVLAYMCLTVPEIARLHVSLVDDYVVINLSTYLSTILRKKTSYISRPRAITQSVLAPSLATLCARLLAPSYRVNELHRLYETVFPNIAEQN